VVSTPPVAPLHPETDDTSGKATWAIDETESVAVALRVNDPVAAGRK
jgi:hypothetical protein